MATEVYASLGGEQVSEELEQLARTRGLPYHIVVGSGPENRALDAWAHDRGVELWFTRPGKPVDDAHTAAFIGRLRDECLN